MNSDFSQLDALRAEWQALQPLEAEREARLWKKLRLEWNYHSNHIEGNTLTYGETELLLLHDRTTGNHSHREYLEMKAHDVGIEHVRALAADEARVLTESDIRDLNKIILKEPFWKAAETADGQSTRKEIIPGDYKGTPNNVRLQNGDMFFFASVEDTAPRMQALADWLRQELETPRLHPVAFAAKLHHDFVLIHPFDDGNGRVARLLVNYVLMRSGCLPVIVRTEDKANYLTALRLADAGDVAPLTEYLGRLAEWSLSLGIKAAKGASIEESSDVEKELAIFVRNQQSGMEKARPRSVAVLRELFNLGFRSFLEQLDAKLKKLEPLFMSHVITLNPTLPNLDSPPAIMLERMIQRSDQTEQYFLHYHFSGYRGQTASPFAITVEVRIHFGEFQFTVVSNGKELTKRLYSNPVLSDEAEAMATTILAEAFAQIKKLSGAAE